MDYESFASESEDFSPVIQDLDADEEIGDCDEAGALAIPCKDDQLQCIRGSDDNQVAIASFSNDFSKGVVVDQRKSQVIIEGADFKGSNVGQKNVVESQQNISNCNVTIYQTHNHYYGSASGPGISKSILHKSSSFTVTKQTPIAELEPPQPSSSKVDDKFIPSEGWIELSEHVTFNNKNPIRKGTKVFRGKQRHVTDQSRDIAVKLLPYSQKNSKEVDFLLKLSSHTNVVQIYESGVCPWPTQERFIAMELCCQNLHDFTEENDCKPFHFMKLATYGKQLVAGLAFIHKNNVVHGDLKPENVLISSCKNYIKLSDFGLSRDIPETRSRASTSSSVAGTDGYRAPELYASNPKVSCSSDMFSLGLVFHFLFTNGKHPFGVDPLDWSYNIRKNRNRNLSQIQKLHSPTTQKKSQLVDLLEGILNHESKSRPTVERTYADDFFKDVPTALDDVGSMHQVRAKTRRRRRRGRGGKSQCSPAGAKHAESRSSASVKTTAAKGNAVRGSSASPDIYPTGRYHDPDFDPFASSPDIYPLDYELADSDFDIFETEPMGPTSVKTTAGEGNAAQDNSSALDDVGSMNRVKTKTRRRRRKSRPNCADANPPPVDPDFDSYALENPYLDRINPYLYESLWREPVRSHTTVNISGSTVNVASVGVRPGSSRSRGRLEKADAAKERRK